MRRFDRGVSSGGLAGGERRIECIRFLIIFVALAFVAAFSVPANAFAEEQFAPTADNALPCLCMAGGTLADAFNYAEQHGVRFRWDQPPDQENVKSLDDNELGRQIDSFLLEYSRCTGLRDNNVRQILNIENIEPSIMPVSALYWISKSDYVVMGRGFDNILTGRIHLVPPPSTLGNITAVKIPPAFGMELGRLTGLVQDLPEKVNKIPYQTGQILEEVMQGQGVNDPIKSTVWKVLVFLFGAFCSLVLVMVLRYFKEVKHLHEEKTRFGMAEEKINETSQSILDLLVTIETVKKVLKVFHVNQQEQKGTLISIRKEMSMFNRREAAYSPDWIGKDISGKEPTRDSAAQRLDIPFRKRMPTGTRPRLSRETLMREYAGCIRTGDIDSFLEKWTPGLLTLENLDKRQENSAMNPIFAVASLKRNAIYWEFEDGREKLLLPGLPFWKRSLALMTAAGGRRHEPYTAHLFDVIFEGTELKALEPAVLQGDGRMPTRKGRLSLPKPSPGGPVDKKENESTPESSDGGGDNFMVMR